MTSHIFIRFVRRRKSPVLYTALGGIVRCGSSLLNPCRHPLVRNGRYNGGGSSAVVPGPYGHVIAMLQKAISEYTPQGDFEQFRQLANGFSQSEGTISARIKVVLLSLLFQYVRTLLMKVSHSLFVFGMI